MMVHQNRQSSSRQTSSSEQEICSAQSSKILGFPLRTILALASPPAHARSLRKRVYHGFPHLFDKLRYIALQDAFSFRATRALVLVSVFRDSRGWLRHGRS